MTARSPRSRRAGAGPPLVLPTGRVVELGARAALALVALDGRQPERDQWLRGRHGAREVARLIDLALAEPPGDLARRLPDWPTRCRLTLAGRQLARLVELRADGPVCCDHCGRPRWRADLHLVELDDGDPDEPGGGDLVPCCSEACAAAIELANPGSRQVDLAENASAAWRVE